MIYMAKKKKAGWEIDETVLDLFETWQVRTGIGKGIAAQLGLWAVMHMDPAERQARLDEMTEWLEATPHEGENAGERLRAAVRSSNHKGRARRQTPGRE